MVDFSSTLRLWFLCSFLASTSVANAEKIDEAAREQLFFRGLVGSCHADLKALRNFNKTSVRKSENLLGLRQELENCHQQVLTGCRIDPNLAEKIVSEKAKFVTDKTQTSKFMWDASNKKTYQDLILRKLCVGIIPDSSLKDLDGVLLVNTDCTGEAYLSEFSRFRNLPDINSQKAPSICETGANVKAKLPTSGKEYWLKFLVISPTSRSTGLFDQTTAIDNVSATVVHEFVHHQRGFNSEFKIWTDKLIKLRFQKVQKQYLHELSRVEADINAEASRIAKKPGLRDTGRNQQILRYAKARMSRFRDWLLAAKLPLRHGMGSQISAWSHDKKEDRPGDYALEGLPIFSDGVPTKFEFGDHVRKSQQYSVWVLDSYALANEEEYIAVAIEIYWHNQKWAERMFSQEELKLLEKHLKK